MKYKESVEKLLEAAKVNEEVGRRVKGTLVDVLGWENGYELAIERALGENAQAIVAEDIYDARWLIEYFKQNISGTIACFPAKDMPPVSHSGHIVRGNGVLGFIVDFIKYEELYAGIVLNLLKDTVLCDTIKSAIEFVKKVGHKYRVVTLTGDTIERSGRLVGVGKNHEKNSF